MGTNVSVKVFYDIHIEPSLDLADYRGRYVSVKARLETQSGDELGTVETDTYFFAPNLPVALAKAYLLNRKISAGKVTPELEL